MGQLAAHNRIRLGTLRVDGLVVVEPAFGPDRTIEPEPSTAPSIGALQMLRPRGALGSTGILRSTTTSIESILLNGGEFTQGEAGTIECIMGDVIVRNTKVHSPATGLRRFLYPRGAIARISFRDVLLTATAATGPLVHGTAMTDGFVHLRNTRHVSGASPTTSVTALPPGRIVTENVTPLVSA